jgi:S-adenosylmethionine-diacylglycerol 3-amino-3-carboxypropyl transferase
MKQVRFDLIRYANCWEDADILVEGLQCRPGQKILSIASGGDNSLALLTTKPELVLAVDLSPAQLYLVELKMLAIRHLADDELPDFLGFRPSEKRLAVYHSLRSGLGTPAKAFWDSQPEVIKDGIIHSGKFERYFKVFREYVLPFIHSRSVTRRLLEAKSAERQVQFYENEWNTFSWKALFRVFFSRFVMGRYGRDPQFLNEVKVPVSEFIFKKAEDELRDLKCQSNSFLRFILMGETGESLPFYLQPHNLNGIRENLDAIQLHHGPLQDGFQHDTFDRFNLSNIFEYMPVSVFTELAHLLSKGANPGARFAYWNLMVPRFLPAVLPEIFEADLETSNQLSKLDKGFFYRYFLVDQKNDD